MKEMKRATRAHSVRIFIFPGTIIGKAAISNKARTFVSKLIDFSVVVHMRLNICALFSKENAAISVNGFGF